MDLFNLWKQLPELDIVDQERESNSNPSHKVPPVDYGEPVVGYENEPGGSIDDESKPKSSPNEEKPIPVAPIVSTALEPTKPEKQEDKGKLEDGDGDEDEWNLLKCPNCSKSFYNNFTLSAHQCKPSPTV